MSKPHAISKEDFGDYSPSLVLASALPTKRLSARVDLFANKLYYSLEFRTADMLDVQTSYQTLDDAIAAYNDI